MRYAKKDRERAVSLLESASNRVCLVGATLDYACEAASASGCVGELEEAHRALAAVHSWLQAGKWGEGEGGDFGEPPDEGEAGGFVFFSTYPLDDIFQTE